MIRVLVVDDSALVREILASGLSKDPEIEVVGRAPDVYIARDKILSLKPDVITLDLEMPKMDGIQFLKRLMPQYPIPVVMVSALTESGGPLALEALRYGAVEIVLKPSKNVGNNLTNMMGDLIEKVKAASKVNLDHWYNPNFSIKPEQAKKITYLQKTTDKIIAVGASTGGTVALGRIIPQLPPDCPGMVVVQHMPPGFTKLFAERLDKDSSVIVREAKNDDRIHQGTVLIAPGGFQCQVQRVGGQYRVRIGGEHKISGHCPSVDLLFESVSVAAGPNAVGIIMTGMGRDGAKGMLKMKQNGALNLAQNEESCVIFGMPGEAQALGGVDKLLPLERLFPEALNHISKLEKTGAKT